MTVDDIQTPVELENSHFPHKSPNLNAWYLVPYEAQTDDKDGKIFSCYLVNGDGTVNLNFLHNHTKQELGLR